MSAVRGRSAVAAEQRSALPRVPGIPWWGAIVVGATGTAIGFAYDAGSGARELSSVFAVCYIAGCLLAVLAVRQSGVFTAVIQPPLLLFIAVPTAYYLFHGSEIAGIKDLLINCGYPLIERFPLMFFTSAVVLVVGLARWYLSLSARRGIAADDDEADPPEKPKRERTRTRTRANSDETTVLDAVDETPRRRTRERERERPTERPSRAASLAADDDEAPPRRPRKPARPAAAAGTSRSRHARPPETEVGEPAPRPRRRPASAAEGPPVDPEPRRRTRAPSSREPRRNLPPVDGPAEPFPYGPPERRERSRRSEYDRPERSERSERAARGDRPEPRRRRAAEYDPYDNREPRPSSGANGSHHPVSRVRYRGDDDREPESRQAPRRPYSADADSWEYDV
ncbi:DUF6542 domain-containing protein [Mycolicibacterium arenosum]|uniref:DUF6542 domain-containing protein n=1 Tax=Mycolicibacterium arenosum TaxID=2952157 RepID=A0ABT1LV04_9MYCO|nr:DUF6542 domain-containing protein [Mycolicibacterium sp. CAU 1645]MCP9270730.1 hypothetical protein [Mycolicibacterium sp. CAU 1645]